MKIKKAHVFGETKGKDNSNRHNNFKHLMLLRQQSQLAASINIQEGGKSE